jgi:hypothetical protein
MMIRLLLLLTLAGGLFAQQQSAATSAVPFVGCASDGVNGPAAAPEGKPVSVPLSAELARTLAFYKAAKGAGVLGPRDWHCFGTVGSGGMNLYVSDEVFDRNKILGADRSKFAGSAIEVFSFEGASNGRFAVAEVIARLFPAWQWFADDLVQRESRPPFPPGPYAADKVTRKSDSIVEYQTIPNDHGLGNRGWLDANASPVDGVAILTGSTPDLLMLNIRLPREQQSLTPVIVSEFERNAPPAQRH